MTRFISPPPGMQPCSSACGRCSRCHLAELAAQRLLADQLGIPQDSSLCRLMLTEEQLRRREWRGYRLDLFGVNLPEEPPDPCPYPVVRRSGIIQLWRERVYWHDSLLYGEVLWNPNEGERVAIHGLEHPHTPAEIASIAAGLRFLRKLTRRGRPVGSGIFRNAGDFRAKVVPIIKRLDRQGKPVTQEAVCNELSNALLHYSYQDKTVFPQQLRSWLKQFNLGTWPEFLSSVIPR